MFNGMHDGWIWAMHGFWWGGWILLIVGLVWAIARSPWARSGSPSSSQTREPPLDILQRHYAEGEMSTDEYEERKERLERDL